MVCIEERCPKFWAVIGLTTSVLKCRPLIGRNKPTREHSELGVSERSRRIAASPVGEMKRGHETFRGIVIDAPQASNNTVSAGTEKGISESYETAGAVGLSICGFKAERTTSRMRRRSRCEYPQSTDAARIECQIGSLEIPFVE